MILSLLLLLSISPTASANTPVWELVQNARRDTPVLHELSPADQHRARLLFRGLLLAAEGSEIPARLREQATGLGLHIRIEEDRVLVWGRENSVGLYVIRLGPALPAILQAPHSFYDLGSGKLTSALFEAGTWRAAYFNSGHRYGRPGLAVEERPDPTPDVAHNPYTLFQAATVAALDALNEPLIAQIHGFRSREGESAVLTSGAALQPSRVHITVQNALEPVLSEVGPVLGAAARPELAGRRNMQGRVVSGHAEFLHLELSKVARDALTEDAVKLAEFNAVLLEAAQ